MGYSNQFFSAVNVRADSKTDVQSFSKKTGIPVVRLTYYNDNNIVPSGKDLDAIVKLCGITEIELKLNMGRLDKSILDAIRANSTAITKLINNSIVQHDISKITPKIAFQTSLGVLYQENCLDILRQMESESIDLIFADPPFNLSKLYPSNIDDSLRTEKYLHWCQDWLHECVRMLKHGGSLFLWNLPRWNSILSGYIDNHLTFRHWIGVDIKYSLPIAGRLYPSHYSLLYYIKGSRPKTFHPDRLPMLTCPKCYGDLKDYGGYKNKMNPNGVNLCDIWTDIPPVRHTKYKRRKGANELSIKLMDRIIEMSSDEGDTVFDPFGGSGTTYMAAELKGRKWIGCEIGPVDDIKNRFSRISEEKEILESYREKLNTLFPKDVHKKRTELGLWVCETFNNDENQTNAKLKEIANTCLRTDWLTPAIEVCVPKTTNSQIAPLIDELNLVSGE